MYNLIESVILAGGYKLSEIQRKAKKLYLMGDITEEELDVLLTMASEGVSADAERPDTLAMLKSLSERLDGFERRLAALEAGGGSSDGDESEGGEASDYEAWEPWDGISDRYQPGAIVTHGGKVWESVFAGQNVWEPGTAGTEALWAEYTDGDVT